ncbi:uncharacterized protein CLUP02_04970 [Colletotrichum lupini]|uniref:Uncharacterized protein n=1 Tax=Colletotrichum lupini TaxID=145971 RepID=A0A9Q8WEB2_9PEZI|nr:uncharacterized protein CLUP02_04970 [Colletotrichum lupini]UQC79490.1 hypothetical protein CLUP02_04970 [Colletotrichum lupini]
MRLEVDGYDARLRPLMTYFFNSFSPGIRINSSLASHVSWHSPHCSIFVHRLMVPIGHYPRQQLYEFRFPSLPDDYLPPATYISFVARQRDKLVFLYFNLFGNNSVPYPSLHSVCERR